MKRMRKQTLKRDYPGYDSHGCAIALATLIIFSCLLSMMSCSKCRNHIQCLIELKLTGCSDGSFGQNCSSTCHCFEKITCDHISGVCPDGSCASGWSGSDCNTGRHVA